jgi:hypothetical protein
MIKNLKKKTYVRWPFEPKYILLFSLSPNPHHESHGLLRTGFGTEVVDGLHFTTASVIRQVAFCCMPQPLPASPRNHENSTSMFEWLCTDSIMCNVCVWLSESGERYAEKVRERTMYIYMYVYIQRESEKERERVETDREWEQRLSSSCTLDTAISSVLTSILLFRLFAPFPSIMGIIEQDLFHISYIKTGKCLVKHYLFFSRMRMLSSWYLYVQLCSATWYSLAHPRFKPKYWQLDLDDPSIVIGGVVRNTWVPRARGAVCQRLRACR